MYNTILNLTKESKEYLKKTALESNKEERIIIQELIGIFSIKDKISILIALYKKLKNKNDEKAITNSQEVKLAYCLKKLDDFNTQINLGEKIEEIDFIVPDRLNILFPEKYNSEYLKILSNTETTIKNNLLINLRQINILNTLIDRLYKNETIELLRTINRIN